MDNSSSMSIKSFESEILPMELEDSASLDDSVEGEDSVTLDDDAGKSLEEVGISSGMLTGDELDELSQLIQHKAVAERNVFPKIFRTLLFIP
ncbi:hypothetical protein [Fibrobacter sp.]|uniref:hypothetical protein n=1 Tax=Fibrobacter sp. TaxID=35828 RepID=UPI0025BF7D66|nr:hypothetical protein [Fibrobacter sp.]